MPYVPEGDTSFGEAVIMGEAHIICPTGQTSLKKAVAFAIAFFLSNHNEKDFSAIWRMDLNPRRKTLAFSGSVTVTKDSRFLIKWLSHFEPTDTDNFDPLFGLYKTPFKKEVEYFNKQALLERKSN